MQHEETTIITLGTVPWFSNAEPTSGSGIVDALLHKQYLQMPNVKILSIYPTVQTLYATENVYPYKVPTAQVPVFTKIPCSSYQFTDMSDAEFEDYYQALKVNCLPNIYSFIAQNKSPNIVLLAHHFFINASLLNEVKKNLKHDYDCNVKLITLVHGTEFMMYQRTNRFHKYIPDISQIDTFYLHSTEQSLLLKRFFPDVKEHQLSVKILGIDTDLFLPNTDKKALKKALQLPDMIKEHHKIVAFAGKFVEWKRIDMLLDATALYEKEDIFTIIAGRGEESLTQSYYKQVEGHQLKNVIFLNYLPQNQLSKLFALADVGVFPSKEEPLGLVFIECIATGTPVVGFKTSVLQNILTPEVAILLEEENDRQTMVEKLADAIQKLFNAKRLVGEKARQIACKYSIYEYAKTIME